MCDFSDSLNIGQHKMRFHDHLILGMRGRRFLPPLRDNTQGMNIKNINSKISISKKNSNSSSDTLNEITNSLEETTISSNYINDDESTKYEESIKCDNSMKNNLQNLQKTYSSAPDLSSFSKKEYITPRIIKRNSLSLSTLNTIDNRKNFILKFSERVSSALTKFKNFDTGICSDLNIDMSSMVKVLKEESLAGIAQYIKENDCKNIIVMSGAGISTNANIPDFRSADRGVYANLEKYNIPYPEAIFELDYFKRNPIPFTNFAKNIYPQSIR